MRHTDASDALLAAGEFCFLCDRRIMQIAARIAPIAVPSQPTPEPKPAPAPPGITRIPADMRVEIGGVLVGMAANIAFTRQADNPPGHWRRPSMPSISAMPSPLDAYMGALGWRHHGRSFRDDTHHVTDPHGRYWAMPGYVARSQDNLEFWVRARMHGPPRPE